MEKEIITEVMDEIEASLKDPRGISAHQRRLAFSLSLGAVVLLENYFKKLGVWKSGSKINHLWLKKNEVNTKKLLEKCLASPIENIPNLDNLLNKIKEIEKERNEIAYGKKASENTLSKKINIFLELKEAIENA